ncbi:probable E3 ubiquitin-protein ligase RHC2A [Olea europaea var. sylvestris]|uniref:probable E3 ubiquitin-protein ligase RHC2A n=1 Tax=Olea europaea var. sylvestris TaxID=158386 RepID=UPI000C1D57BA|nr:probable E3 ubiquitin-protein ligase RHC2A [Olea europaea var. sylvestris]
MSMDSAYWCYRCNRFVRVWTQDSIACPDCNGGFVEEIENANPSSISDSRRRRYPAAAMYMMRNPESGPGSGLGSSPRIRRSRRNGGDRSPFNPVIVLRGPNDGGGGATAGGGFALYYDDGTGSGLRPLPDTMSEFLLGSGFDRLLDQLSQIEANGIGRIDSNPPASKAAIESMPTVEINDQHIAIESHCAVCKEAFDLGSEAREMPCKHLYHQDCILPWLSLRNSCPVCRHELPTDDDNNDSNYHRDTTSVNRGGNEIVNEDETVGLTIWRLPGGGFAVGRFSGGRRGGDRELPVVYTEMDGGFNNNGIPRRISWGSNGSVSQERGGLMRVLRGLFSCFGGNQSSTSSSSSDSRISQSGSFGSTSRRRRGWGFDVNEGNSRRW